MVWSIWITIYQWGCDVFTGRTNFLGWQRWDIFVSKDEVGPFLWLCLLWRSSFFVCWRWDVFAGREGLLSLKYLDLFSLVRMLSIVSKTGTLFGEAKIHCLAEMAIRLTYILLTQHIDVLVTFGCSSQ